MPQSLLERSRPFVEFLDEWTQALPSVDLKSVIQQPERSAIISVDIINGFCTIGPLASPRVEAIVAANYASVPESLGARRKAHCPQPGYP